MVGSLGAMVIDFVCFIEEALEGRRMPEILGFMVRLFAGSGSREGRLLLLIVPSPPAGIRQEVTDENFGLALERISEPLSGSG
mmetsp:Transcript_9691/g.14403  ORF Transcript_9691/g.14403 Transcript_9691/m.14403 type:complete len:83 (+) Transcript_9691:119-367(+)